MMKFIWCLLAVPTLAFATRPFHNTSNGSANGLTCRRALQEAYTGLVLSPSDPALGERTWTENGRLDPSCVILPTSAQEVSLAVKILVSPLSRKGGPCQFAIKSGGHMPHAGSNDIDGGVTIDLSWINETTLAADRKSVRLGTGGTWGNAYAALNGTGVAFPGGRCKTTGIGGIALGGRYSWLTPRVGWVADNVVNYEVVLADGEIVNANKESYGDLFVALKGGGNNFGIVTRFDVAAFEHDQRLWGGYKVLPTSATSTVLEGFSDFVSHAANDSSAALALEFVINRNTSSSSILTWLTATDGKVNDHPGLKSFIAMNNTLADTTGPTTFADYPGAVPPVQRVLFSTTTIKARPEVIQAVHQMTLKVYDDFGHIPDLTWDIQYEPLPHAYIQRGFEQGGPNVLGLNYTTEDLAIVFLMPLWKDAAYDEEVSKAITTWLERVQQYSNVYDAGFPFEYLNYAAPWQDVLGSYGAPNLQFLKDVAKKYDPRGVFQRLVPGGFKLK